MKQCLACGISVCSICRKCHQARCTARSAYCGRVRIHYRWFFWHHR